VVKKDTQQNCYTLAYQKKNDTKILPDSRTKIPDAISVFGDNNQVSLMQSEKQVRLERLSRVFPYPITTESLAKQTAKIS
jgi:hypothetical protein